MPSPHELPHFIPGFTAAGAAALKKAQPQFAEWQLADPKKPLDASLSDAQALAEDFLGKLKFPSHLFDRLDEAAQDRVAQAVGVVPLAKWVSPPVPPGTPSYREPSWEKDVYAVLFAQVQAPPPQLRVTSTRVASHVSKWPELAALSRWKAKGREGLGKVLAAKLGAGWKAAAPTAELGLPRVTSSKLGLTFVAVPGGTFELGLQPAEQKALLARVKAFGPEAVMHVKSLAATCRPVRKVTVAPFLCAETPLLEAHVKKLGATGDAGNPHRVLRCEPEAAARVVEGAGARLPSEAEWEWLAREGGEVSWLCGEAAPEAWVTTVLRRKLTGQPHPLSVFGLGWGEWVDDGWHPTYRGAPKTAEAWAPKTRPELARGGGLALWPWQAGGEFLLLHAANREKTASAQAVRLVLPLPAR